jgi:hypothetical protein
LSCKVIDIIDGEFGRGQNVSFKRSQKLFENEGIRLGEVERIKTALMLNYHSNSNNSPTFSKASTSSAASLVVSTSSTSSVATVFSVLDELEHEMMSSLPDVILKIVP